MAGMTEKGFTVKRLGEIITGMKNRAREIFQDLVPPGDSVDVGDTSAIGRLVGVISPSIEEQYQTGLEIYQAFDIDNATGVSLDNLTRIGGIERLEASKTTVGVYMLGRIGTTTYAGYSARSSKTSETYNILSDVEYYSQRTFGVGISVKSYVNNQQYTVRYRRADTGDYTSITVSSGQFGNAIYVLEQISYIINNDHQGLTSWVDGELLVIRTGTDFQMLDFLVSDELSISHGISFTNLESQNYGAYDEAPGDVNIIATPIYGWETVVNPFSSVLGREREDDETLRERFRLAKFDRAINIIESLYSELIQTNGVNSVVIFENDTNEVDSRGLPPHSFLPMVDGGVPVDIARAIWDNRPVGITSVGNTSATIPDMSGYPRVIRFSRPVEIPVFIEIKLTTDDRFPVDGEELIRTALMDYINGMKLNSSVIYSRLYTPINSVPGHQVDSLRIGTDPANLGVSNIEVMYDQIPKTSYPRITFL